MLVSEFTIQSRTISQWGPFSSSQSFQSMTLNHHFCKCHFPLETFYMSLLYIIQLPSSFVPGGVQQYCTSVWGRYLKIWTNLQFYHLGVVTKINWSILRKLISIKIWKQNELTSRHWTWLRQWHNAGGWTNRGGTERSQGPVFIYIEVLAVFVPSCHR